MARRRFHARASSPGIVIGPAFKLERAFQGFPRYWIANQVVDREVKRFRAAVQRSYDQLTHILRKVCRFQGYEQMKILESHKLFLQDELLVQQCISCIQKSRINAEWALDKTVQELKLSFASLPEAYMRERSQDLNYVSRRVMGNLLGTGELSINKIPAHASNAILVAHDISPADVVHLSHHHIAGIVMEVGGETSHTAIIARALEIPGLFGVQGIMSQIHSGETLILDAVRGSLIAAPKKTELKQYQVVQQRYQELERQLLKDIHLPAQTKDGSRIALEANIELAAEVGSLTQFGAEGVGLYRTEFAFINQVEPPSEDEQLEEYLTVLDQLHPKLVTIRTLDLGADKLVLNKSNDENNPALGLRGIRLCLRERSLFKTQLRAILRASVVGNLRLLIPMISSLEEVRLVKKILREVMRELEKEKRRFAENIPLGIMIEVPSAVMLAEEFAQEVDFFSIGTNDLLQYCLAADRTNEAVSHTLSPFHPALLRMIQMTCAAAQKFGKPVSLCGEMAADPATLPILLGLPLSSLSMNPVSIPKVKRVIRSLSRAECEAKLQAVLKLASTQEVEQFLKPSRHKDFPSDVLTEDSLSET